MSNGDAKQLKPGYVENSDRAVRRGGAKKMKSGYVENSDRPAAPVPIAPRSQRAGAWPL